MSSSFAESVCRTTVRATRAVVKRLYPRIMNRIPFAALGNQTDREGRRGKEEMMMNRRVAVGAVGLAMLAGAALARAPHRNADTPFALRLA